MAFPLLVATVWVGLRFATLLSVLHSFVVGTVTMRADPRRRRPVRASSRTRRSAILLAQFFLAMLLVTGLLLATGRDEREQLAGELATAERGGGLPGRRARHRHRLDGRGPRRRRRHRRDPDGRTRRRSVALGFDPTDAAATTSTSCRRPVRRRGSRSPNGQRPSRRALARGDGAQRPGRLPARPGRSDGCSRSRRRRCRATREQDRARARAADPRRHHTSTPSARSWRRSPAWSPTTCATRWPPSTAGPSCSTTRPPTASSKPQVVQEFVSRVRASSTRMHGLILHLLAHATSRNRTSASTGSTSPRPRSGSPPAATPPTSSPSGRSRRSTATGCSLDQVLENLIGNALKYVAAGVRPHVDVNGALDGAGHGPGVRRRQRHRPARGPARARSSTSSTACTPRGYEGTGLGLAIVRRIVTRHGGTVARPRQPDRRHGLRVHRPRRGLSARTASGLTLRGIGVVPGARLGWSHHEHALRHAARTPPPHRPEQPAATARSGSR